MTLQDEARDLLRQQRAAEDELTAVRREIEEVVNDRGGHVDVAVAEDYSRRLKAAQERVREVKQALADLKASRLLRGSLDEPAHWCPGCNEMHVLPWKRGGWTFNGDVERPTFTPSFLHRWKSYDDGKPTPKICHYILTDGVLNFCSDCTHALAGKSVPLPELPAEWQD